MEACHIQTHLRHPTHTHHRRLITAPPRILINRPIRLTHRTPAIGHTLRSSQITHLARHIRMEQSTEVSKEEANQAIMEKAGQASMEEASQAAKVAKAGRILPLPPRPADRSRASLIQLLRIPTWLTL